MSWVLVPVMTTERGVPVGRHDAPLGAELALVGGVGAVFFPRGGLDGTGVEGLPLPLDPLRVVVPLEEPRPQPLEDPMPHPLLEPSVGGRTRTVFSREGLPLTSGLQHVEYSVHHLPERDRGLPLVPGFFSSLNSDASADQTSSGIRLIVGNYFMMTVHLQSRGRGRSASSSEPRNLGHPLVLG